MKKFLKVLKWIAIVIAVIILLFLLVRFIIIKHNNKTPEGGINETSFVEINGSHQWVNIYGQDVNNPVLLYIHGGPCSATSALDWSSLRKLSEDYTVVNWDQRGCGHNYPKYKEESALTSKTMMKDGEEMTDYLRERFGQDKITLMGMSWGSVLGSNLVLENPEKYDAMIALSLVVDIEESQTLFKEYTLEKSADDEKMHALAESIDPADWSMKSMSETMPLIMKYGHLDNYASADSNVFTAALFNPYCSIPVAIRMIIGTPGYLSYRNGTLLPEPQALIDPLSLKDKTEYKVPYYVLEGDSDHANVTMQEEAAAYFEKISAPDKEMQWINGGGHNSPLLQSDELAEFVHKIAEKRNQN